MLRRPGLGEDLGNGGLEGGCVPVGFVVDAQAGQGLVGLSEAAVEAPERRNVDLAAHAARGGGGDGGEDEAVTAAWAGEDDEAGLALEGGVGGEEGEEGGGRGEGDGVEPELRRPAGGG